MKRILIVGAGLSTSCLINYLLERAEKYDWEVVVGDIDLEMAKKKTNGHPRGKSIKFDVFNDTQRSNEVKKADIIVSMLPARFHYLIVRSALRYRKNMVTASYISTELKALNEEAKEKGILILNEIGLDPGIDHLSAMRIIDNIKDAGGEITAFKSSTGGLVAPKYDNNPWNYKFTWNPRNVVLAGQGVAQYIDQNMYKHIPYHKLFTRIRRIYIDNYGEFEVYPNRDSLKYRSIYGLDDVPTMIRGTIRRPGFSKTWNLLVQLGATDDSFIVENSEKLTNRDFINTFLKYHKTKTVEEKLAEYLNVDEDSFDMYKLRWLGLFDRTPVDMKNVTPAQILQKIMEEKLSLDENDKDMIVMQHEFIYKNKEDQTKLITSSLVVEGQDDIHTAMAMTVGLPLGIATKLILTDKIPLTGVVIPTSKLIYEPVLKELEDYNIKFFDKEEDYEA